MLIVLCVCVLGGIMLSEEIISLLYQWGKFSADDTLIVAQVFSAYMIGLVPFGLSKIFSLWLYSHQMQGKAAKISAISLGCGVIFSLVLMHPFGAMGLALSGSLSGFVLFVLTIRIFGFKQFLAIINNKKAWLLLVGIVGLESLLLWYLKPYVKALVDAFHLFVRNIL